MADVSGFALMAAFGGAMVSLADQTSLRLAPALGVVFTVGAVIALVGILAGRRVRDDAVSG